MAKSMKGPRFVSVTWEDAWSDDNGEWSPENVHESHHPAVMQTVGWLLLENDVGVSIFNERDTKTGGYRGRTFIPGRMIMKVEDFPPKRIKRKNAKLPVSELSQGI